MESLIREMQSRKKTGLVYSPNHVKHAYYPDIEAAKMHVEHPGRASDVLQHLEQVGIKDRCDFVTDFGQVDMDLVGRVHDQKYVEYLNKLWPETSNKVHMLRDDTYYNKHSVMAARYAAQGTIEAVEGVISGKWENSFALVRPPGHHAGVEGKVEGFCLINNVVVAARYLQEVHGLKKIAILDWDVHHGDSTQKLTYDDPSILFISIHKYCHSNFYPHKTDANYDLIGKDKGLGFNLNFPLNPEKNEVL